MNDAELFVVYGYNEDPNLTYFYLTSVKAGIYHRSNNIIIISNYFKVFFIRFNR